MIGMIQVLTDPEHNVNNEVLTNSHISDLYFNDIVLIDPLAPTYLTMSLIQSLHES